MSKQQRGLGKGISALFGDDADLGNIRKPVGYINKEVVSEEQPRESGPKADVLLIPVDMIEPNPFQPRMSFDQEALEELAADGTIAELAEKYGVATTAITDFSFFQQTHFLLHSPHLFPVPL